MLCTEGFGDLCLEVFNECEVDQGQLLGRSPVELDLRKHTVRTAEAAAGNLVADAFYYTAHAQCVENGTTCPDAAWQNGGGIRSQTPCGEREIIPAGPLYEGDVQQMLPFGNPLVVVSLSGRDIKLALEHSVDELGLPGTAGEAGHFLQNSRIRFKVDCSQPSHTLDANLEQIVTPGSRIREGSIEIRTDSGGPDDDPVWGPVDAVSGAIYHIAMSSFLASGADGFLALVKRDSEDRTICTSSPCDGNYQDQIAYTVTSNGAEITETTALAYYIQERETVTPIVDGRITITTSCIAGLE